ncbi:ARID DNA-binding domain-containing protein [Tanacetum coccineum]
MSNSKQFPSKWPRSLKPPFGRPNKWYQSKPWRHLERKQHVDFIHRELRRQKEANMGSCIRQISQECKDMLKKEMEGIMQYNNKLNHSQPSLNEQEKFKTYKCFRCKQIGHIVKFCPEEKKESNKSDKMDILTIAKERMENFKPTKPSVLIQYPESIHIPTKFMIKGTDHENWDDIWYISDQTDKHLCTKIDTFCNIKEEFSVTKLKDQMKFLFTYGIGDIYIKDDGHGYLVPGVHYAPEVTLNILSMDLLEKQGYEIKYDGNRCSLTYMFNNKEHQIFNEDRMRTLHNQYLENYFGSLDDGIDEGLIRIKGSLYSTKVQTFNDYVYFLNLVKQDEIVDQEWDYFRNRFNKALKWFYTNYLETTLPGPIPPTINGTQIHLFDLYKLVETLGGYLNVQFCQEFDIIGEMMGLPKGFGDELKRCYNQYLDVFTSYFKTARAPRRECIRDFNQADPNLPSNNLEEGTGAQPNAGLKGKEKVEHFGVKLEGTSSKEDTPGKDPIPHSARNLNLQGMHSRYSIPRMQEEDDSGTDNTSKEFKFTIITIKAYTLREIVRKSRSKLLLFYSCLCKLEHIFCIILKAQRHVDKGFKY